MRLLGLTLKLDSVVGRGSRFALSLPIAETTVDGAAVKRPDAQDRMTLSPTPRLTLLVVDDDPAVRGGMEALLGRSGHAVRAVADGAAARVAAKGIDAALVDYDLGEEDGLTLIAELRRHAPLLPAIIITADGSPATAERAAASGIALLLKPVDPVLLEEWLSGVVQDRHAENPSL